jgi:hypothetical protein
LQPPSIVLPFVGIVHRLRYCPSLQPSRVLPIVGVAHRQYCTS